MTPGRWPYKLLRTGDYGECSVELGGDEYDTRYRQVSAVREQQLFDDNGVTYVIRNLPRYPIADTAKYTWSLYNNSYYEWNPDCWGANSNRGAFIANLHITAGLADNTNSLYTVCIIYFIVSTIILNLIYVILANQRKVDRTCWMIFVAAKVSLGIVLLFLKFYYGLAAYFSISNNG